MVQPDEIHALYRFYGQHDELLYIGITYDPPLRFRKHSAQKPWWVEISRIAVEKHPNRDAVLEAERRAILSERPRWNVTHNARPVALENDPAIPGGRIRWVCGTCEVEIWRGGALYVDLERASEVMRSRVKEDHRRFVARAQLDDGVLETAFAALPLIRWHVACEDCVAERSYSYDISLDQCRSLAALIRWTAHLYGKSWFRATDWIDFIHEVAQLTGSPLESVGVY